MSFSFTLCTKSDSFDIGRNLGGLWDSLSCCRTNPTPAELLNDPTPDFRGWVIPEERIIEIYAGLTVIESVRPTDHPTYPDLDPDCTIPGGYWRLVMPGDVGEDFRFSMEQFEKDNRIVSIVYRTYARYISHGCGYGTPGDYNGDLSVYFWEFVTDFKKFLEKAIKSGEYKEMTFIGG